MTHAWKQTIEINESIASQVISAQHQIDIECIELLDSGWDNVVYLVNKTFIFRFPRREFGLDCIANEITFLPFIKEHVSFPLSSPNWVGKPSSQYPYPYAGYEMLKGLALSDQPPVLIDSAPFAKVLAHWLRELHQLPVTLAQIEAVKGEYEWKVNVFHRLTGVKDNLTKYGKYYDDAGLHRERLLQTIKIMESWNFTPSKRCFVHGDLYARHIIVDDQSMPKGIIDWGDIHIGHPGIDLAVGMIFTPEVFQEFLSSYGAIDEETHRILLFHCFCHGMSFLPYTFEQNKANLTGWATIVLHRVMDEIHENFGVKGV